MGVDADEVRWIEGKSRKELKGATGIHGVSSRDMFVEGMGGSSVWLPRV